MALYTIGDLHLSFGADKPMDHFKGWDNYVQRLERNWRALVEPGDTVMIAGDISWGMTLEEAAPDFAFLQSLPRTVARESAARRTRQVEQLSLF